jgi:iron complex outermembrane receptor protein
MNKHSYKSIHGAWIKASLLMSAAAISLMAAETAHAQAPQDQQGQVETIIVTAQRRAERLQDVPISITHMSSDQLTQADVQSTADIAAITPALRYDFDGPFAEPTIRGVGTTLVGQTTGTDVGTYIDGFYLPSPLEADFQLINVDSIEVLKGPQGTLFGRNTNGGAILVNTSKPSSDTHAIAEVDYGSYNAQNYKGYVTTGWNDKVAVDAAVNVSKGDGYVYNLADNSHTDGRYLNWSVRAGLKVDVTDNYSILFHYLHQSVNDPTNNLQQPAVVNGVPESIGIFLGASYAGKPNQIDEQFHNYYHAHSDSYQLTNTFDLNFATLTSYTQYRQDKQANNDSFSNSNPDFYNVTFTNHETTITQEFLLASKPGPRLQWTVGGFYLDEYALLNAYLAPGATTNYFFAGGSSGDIKSLATYGDATYRLLDKLYLTAGVRFSHDEMLKPDNILAINPFFFPNLSYNKVTTRAVVRYNLDDQSNVYASFSQGFKAGLWDLGGPTNIPVKPETITAFETGYKYASQSFSADVAAFYYNWKNIQVSNLVEVNQQTESNLTNAADSHIYGVDGQARYEIVSGLEANLGAAYTHARYVNFTTAPGYFQCVNPVTCGAAFGAITISDVNAAGFHMPHAPDFTATLGLRYTTDLAGGKLGLSSNLYYTSKFYFDSPNQFSQAAYATLGLRADWTDPSKRFTLAVYADNVTNNHYLTQVAEGQGSIGVTYSKPVTVGGSVRVNF